MLTIGMTRRGKEIQLTDTERARHIHLLGSVGTGKSKVLEYLIRQDVARSRGLCLIDPHGTLADALEVWCAMRGFGKRPKIHIIKPGDDTFVPGFNPLRSVPGEALSVRVDAMVAACAQAWGVNDMSDTPRLEKILRATFFALAARGLTLAEGPTLLQGSDPEGTRRNLTTNLPDPVVQIIWNELNGMSRKDFSEHVESTHTRLSKFLTAPAMRLVVGQRDHAIDFRKAMDDGEIVIINLGARKAFSYENARVLGTLLINDLFLSALGRDAKTAQRRPFTLYVDEAYDFLSGDVERILDQSRKFGLHAVLAHQRLGQLRERGEGIYNAVMGCTQTKIVLGGLSDDDAMVMAREIMRGDIDLTTPKPGLTMPVIVDEVPFWLDSESSSTAYSSSITQSDSRFTSDSLGVSDGESASFAGMGLGWGFPQQRGSFSAESSSSGEGRAITESTTESFSSAQTHGRSQTLKAVREERPSHYYSLEESLHLATLKIRTLPDQTAIVKRRGKRTVQVSTVEVKPVLNAPRIVQRFRNRTAALSNFLTPMESAQSEIFARQQEAFALRPPDQGNAQFWAEE